MACSRLSRKPLQEREGETGSLAGSGLRGAEKVASCEHNWNGLRLNWGGLRVALVGYRTHEFGPQAETFKVIANDLLLSSACEGITFDRFRQMRFRLVIERSRVDRLND